MKKKRKISGKIKPSKKIKFSGTISLPSHWCNFGDVEKGKLYDLSQPLPEGGFVVWGEETGFKNIRKSK